MTTLSAYGMGPQGFRVNRKLSTYELENRLDVGRPAFTRVNYELSLLRFNSTFLESVDKWYALRGFVALAAFLFTSLAAALLGFTAYLLATEPGFWTGVLVFFQVGLVGYTVKYFCEDAFTYTHYPIRFNRKNRQVYAFRRDGTVLKAGWDELVWTLYASGPRAMDVFVIGHVMDPQTDLIKESIGLSVVSVGRAGEQECREHFEFFRRYMENGAESVLHDLRPTPLIMLPRIDQQRESWAFGWERLTLHMNGFLLGMILYQVVALPTSLFRWVVMRTSKIPQWPQWVEDECEVEPNDMWARDERH